MTVVQARRRERLSKTMEAAARLEKLGIPLSSRPRRELPDLPGDMTELTDESLLATMHQFRVWADYSGAQLAIAEVDERYAEEFLAKLTALGLISTTRVEGDSDKRGVTERRAANKTSAEYQEAQSTVLEAYARRKLLTARTNAFEKSAELLSRELTRRTARDPREKRVSRLSS